MKLVQHLHRYPAHLLAWMLAVCLSSSAFAQDAAPNEDATENEVVENVEATPVEDAGEPSLGEPDAAADESSVNEPRRIRHRNQPAFTVFGKVEVDEGESANEIVAILGDYVLNGRVRNVAVTVLGKGVVNGEVDRECVTVLGEVEVNGTVDGDLVVVGGKAYINGRVDGNMVLVLSDVEFGPNASADGDIVIVGPEPKVDPQATISSPHPYVPLPSFSFLGEYFRKGPLLLRPIAPGVAWVWYTVLFFFLFRLILLLIFPRPINAGVEVMREGSVRTFLIGVIAYILYLPALALLGATVVGGIAVPFVALAWEVATILGKISFLVLLGNHLGRQLNSKTLESPLGGFIAGTVLVTLIYMVPVLGMIVFFLIKPLAVGCMLVAAVDAFQRERKPPVIPPSMPPPGGGTSTLHTAAVATAPNDPSGAGRTDVPPVLGAAVSPAPTPDELSTYRRVGFWPRFGASILDLILIIIATGVLAQRGEWFPVIWIAYHVAMWTWRGTTLGGIVFSIRIVRLDGRRFDFVTAVVRLIGATLSLLVAGLGFFWASWNPDKQSWHDMIAGTIVVKTPRATPLV